MRKPRFTPKGMYNNLQNSYTLSANHHVYREVKSLMSLKCYKWMSVKWQFSMISMSGMSTNGKESLHSTSLSVKTNILQQSTQTVLRTPCLYSSLKTKNPNNSQHLEVYRQIL